MKSYLARQFEAIHADELRQPWVEGFDEAFDNIFFEKPFMDIHKEVVMTAVGLLATPAENPFARSDALSMIKSSQKFESYFGAKQYAFGSATAYFVLENTEVAHV
jgi:hypothetical protein